MDVSNILVTSVNFDELLLLRFVRTVRNVTILFDLPVVNLPL